MDAKKITGLVLIAIGAIAVIAGVIGIFGSSIIPGVNSWALAIIGVIFFPAGISLMKTTKSA